MGARDSQSHGSGSDDQPIAGRRDKARQRGLSLSSVSSASEKEVDGVAKRPGLQKTKEATQPDTAKRKRKSSEDVTVDGSAKKAKSRDASGVDHDLDLEGPARARDVAAQQQLAEMVAGLRKSRKMKGVCLRYRHSWVGSEIRRQSKRLAYLASGTMVANCVMLRMVMNGRMLLLVLWYSDVAKTFHCSGHCGGAFVAVGGAVRLVR